MNKYNIINDINYTINFRDGIINDLLVDDYFYYHEFYDFHKNKDSLSNNIIYICFDKIVQIKYIKIDNTNDERFNSNDSTKKLSNIFYLELLITDYLNTIKFVYLMNLLLKIGNNIKKLSTNKFYEKFLSERVILNL